MGVGYEIVNFSRRERVSFAHIPASKKRELAGNPVASAISTWYFLENSGDRVAFVSDTYGDWPFPEGASGEHQTCNDVTDLVVDELIGLGILKDFGREIFCPDEPEVYVRLLKNVWFESAPVVG